jgi:hypothetical protein
MRLTAAVLFLLVACEPDPTDTGEPVDSGQPDDTGDTTAEDIAIAGTYTDGWARCR